LPRDPAVDRAIYRNVFHKIFFMFPVNPKKSLGQHFLADNNIARKITSALTGTGYEHVVEVGPGTGILTEYLVRNHDFTTHLVEIDGESVDFLRKRFPEMKERISQEDFLRFNLSGKFSAPIAIIGNFPYNISSQIFFRILENRNIVKEVVCMVQKEVAERITAPPGSRTYGILSVLLQAFYETRYLFGVGRKVFIPPPRVMSAVISLTRKPEVNLRCDEEMFFRVVKTAFNQRRKMLRNSLSAFLEKKVKNHGSIVSGGPAGAKTGSGILKGRPANGETAPIVQKPANTGMEKLLSCRPEQLGTDDFVKLTNFIVSI